MTQRTMLGGTQPDKETARPVRAPRRLSPQVLFRLAVVLCAGLAIAWVDTRPGWDDTGVTAGALLVTATAGALAGVRPWLVTVLVVGPMLAAELPGGLGVLLGIPFALLGAYSGALVRRHALGR